MPKATIPAKGGKKKATSPIKKNPDDMTLKERMAARMAKEKDMPMGTEKLFKASDGLTSAQQEAIVRGAGHKIAPHESLLFKELNQEAGYSSSDDEQPKGKLKPADLAKRRQYALKESSPNGAAHAKIGTK